MAACQPHVRLAGRQLPLTSPCSLPREETASNCYGPILHLHNMYIYYSALRFFISYTTVLLGFDGREESSSPALLVFFSPFLPCLQNVYASMQTSAEVGYYRGESEREGGRETGTKRGDGKGVSERLREAVDASER